MSTTNRLRHIHRRLLASRRSAVPAPRWARPCLEALEERLTPTTFNVTPTGTGLQSLLGAITQANMDTTSDTILLAPGQYNLTPQQQISQLVVLTKNALTIEGTGSSASATVIDATQIHNRAFLLSVGTNVTFQNLTIQHGLAQDDGSQTLGSPAEGGGILDVGGNLTLNNVVVQNNTAQGVFDAPALGGGIDVLNGSLTIRSSVIQNNQALAGNGDLQGSVSVYAVGGGIAIDAIDNAGEQLSINASTVAGNLAHGGVSPAGGIAEGGGISSRVSSSLIDSTLSDNKAIGGDWINNGVVHNPGSNDEGGTAWGGGGNFFGKVDIVNSTIAKNAAVAGADGPDQGHNDGGFGGGLSLINGPTGSITNVTVAYNEADGVPGQPSTSSGGGILNGNVSLTNSLVALNIAATNPDYDGNVNDGGHNLIGIYEPDPNSNGAFSTAKGDLFGSTAHPLDPHLGPLQTNGGPTQTIALLPGSPALNAGDNSAQSVTGPNDQRGAGFSRVFNGAIDIGAFEVQPSPSGGGGGGGGVVPVGPLMLFGFGFGSGGQLDLFEVDRKGEVFALTFNFANFMNPDAANAQFLNTDMVMQNMAFSTAGGFPALLGSLEGSNHQAMLMMTVPISFMPSAAFSDVLTAWQASGA